MTAADRPFTRLAATIAFGPDSPQVRSLEAGLCPTCGTRVNPTEFRDSLSLKEFGITGLCQTCQDGIFASPPEGTVA